MADAEILEHPRTVANVHVRPHGQDRLGHDLVDIDPLGRTIPADHLFGDVREQQQTELVAFVATLNDQAGCADLLHYPHCRKNIHATVDFRHIGLHAVAHATPALLGHMFSSTISLSSCAWCNTPTASSTSTTTAIPVPGFASNSPTSPICSRMCRLKCFSTSKSTTSRCVCRVRPKKVLLSSRPSPRALLITVQPVAPASRAACMMSSVLASSTNASISLKCMVLLLSQFCLFLPGFGRFFSQHCELPVGEHRDYRKQGSECHQS